MNPIFAAGLEAESFCRARGWRVCFIGALAVQRWGEPRLTLGVDLTVPATSGEEGAYVDALLAHFPGRLPDAREFGLQHLVVFKAFAGREKDWLDIQGIAVRQHGRLDESLIWAELTPLLVKEAPEAAERLQAILAGAKD